MKIVNGIIAQLPYTPPRTQLCIVELEDSIATSRTPSEQIIKQKDNITVNDFEENPADRGESFNGGTIDWTKY